MIINLDVEDLLIGAKQKKELNGFLKFIKKINSNKDKPAIEILLDIVNEIDLKNYYLNQPNIDNHERWKNVAEKNTEFDYWDRPDDRSILFLKGKYEPKSWWGKAWKRMNPKSQKGVLWTDKQIYRK